MSECVRPCSFLFEASLAFPRSPLRPSARHSLCVALLCRTATSSSVGGGVLRDAVEAHPGRWRRQGAEQEDSQPVAAAAAAALVHRNVVLIEEEGGVSSSASSLPAQGETSINRFIITKQTLKDF